MESARRSSSLPSGVFRARSPGVEQALVGGVAELFLRHMSRDGVTADVGVRRRAADQQHEDTEEITAADRDALLAACKEHATVTPPPLADGIATERSWVLLDLTQNGSPRTRAAAWAELLELAHSEPPFDGHDALALTAFAAALEQVAAKPRQQPLVDELRRAVHAAIRHGGGGSR